jgi:tRNA G18 (ribose-2'-O)-methylase SpoU
MNLHVRSFDVSMTPEEYAIRPKLPVHIILDNLRSAFNVGSIIRTADCARVEQIHFCGYTAHPPNPKLQKTALGTIDYVPWTSHASAIEAIQEMKDHSIPVIALETTNRSVSLWDFTFPPSCALIVGNEALGVAVECLKTADAILEIPMIGFKNSINVAVALGIALYEIQRQQWHQIKPHWQALQCERTSDDKENTDHQHRYHHRTGAT